MQVFHTARNDVLCNNIKTYSVLIAFFAADPFKHSMSCTLYSIFTLYIRTQEEGVYLSRYLMEKRISMIQESINEKVTGKIQT